MRILFIPDVPLANPTSGSEQVLNQQAPGLTVDWVEFFAITHQGSAPVEHLKG